MQTSAMKLRVIMKVMGKVRMRSGNCIACVLAKVRRQPLRELGTLGMAEVRESAWAIGM